MCPDSCFHLPYLSAILLVSFLRSKLVALNYNFKRNIWWCNEGLFCSMTLITYQHLLSLLLRLLWLETQKSQDAHKDSIWYTVGRRCMYKMHTKPFMVQGWEPYVRSHSFTLYELSCHNHYYLVPLLHQFEPILQGSATCKKFFYINLPSQMPSLCYSPSSCPLYVENIVWTWEVD